jgi:micrococcal nuclease
VKIFRKLWLVPILVVLLLLIRFVGEIGHDRAPDDRFKIIGVIDGDTVELLGRDRLRLLGIDCPERGQPFYDSATAYLTHLALDKIARVEFSHRRRDKYDRLLAYITIDSQFVNAMMVRNGLAYVYLFDDNLADRKHIEQLLAAQNDAIDHGCGIWSIKHEKEPYYVAKKGGLRFHRPGCNSVKNLGPGEFIKFDTRLDAFRKGLSPCRNCRP